jgi:hypothetical protein
MADFDKLEKSLFDLIDEVLEHGAGLDQPHHPQHLEDGDRSEEETCKRSQ